MPSPSKYEFPNWGQININFPSAALPQLQPLGGNPSRQSCKRSRRRHPHSFRRQKTQHKIRLQGIDAPEKAQAFGQKSKQSLNQLVHSKMVTVEFEKKDKHGRTVGKVLLNGTDVCLEQIKLGMAWHYKQYQSEQSKEDRDTYAQAEQTAKAQAAGLWKDKSPTPPWAFRRQRN